MLLWVYLAYIVDRSPPAGRKVNIVKHTWGHLRINIVHWLALKMNHDFKKWYRRKLLFENQISWTLDWKQKEWKRLNLENCLYVKNVLKLEYFKQPNWTHIVKWLRELNEPLLLKRIQKELIVFEHQIYIGLKKKRVKTIWKIFTKYSLLAVGVLPPTTNSESTTLLRVPPTLSTCTCTGYTVVVKTV